MRMMMKVSIPVEKGNDLIKKGTLGKTMQSILAEMKPEAAYFCADQGKRTGYIFFNMNDTSQIPSLAEPFFLALDASIELQPVMNPDDLSKAMAGIGPTAQKYA
jgi:hypothetical protein